LTVTTADEVTVSVITLVQSSSAVELWVEFVQRMDEVPMGSVVSMVVPAVPVRVGSEVTVVWFQLRELEKFPGTAVAVDKPWVQGTPEVEVAFIQGPWLL
jgi:hypothetical protein